MTASRHGKQWRKRCVACYPSLPPASDTPLMISEDLKFVIWVSSSHMPIQLFLRAIHRPKFTSGGLRLGYFHPILAYMVHPLIVSRGTMVKRPQRICQFGWMRSIVSCLTSITSLVFTFLDLMLHPPGDTLLVSDSLFKQG